MWEPRRLTTLWASTASYRDSCTFLHFIQKEPKKQLHIFRRSIAHQFITLNYGALELLSSRKFAILFLLWKRKVCSKDTDLKQLNQFYNFLRVQEPDYFFETPLSSWLCLTVLSTWFNCGRRYYRHQPSLMDLCSHLTPQVWNAEM
jgi:hypothetical protein